MDYLRAKALLESARSRERGKPIANNTRVVDCTMFDESGNPEPAIGILYHHTIVVAFSSNGRVVLNSGGWRTVTTKERLDNSGIRVYSVKGKWFVMAGEPIGYTPERVTKCRTCNGAGQTKHFTYGEYQLRDGAPASVVSGDAVLDHYAYWANREWVTYPEPKVSFQDCYRCKTVGRVDYGSNPIYPEFVDGMTFDANGAITYCAAPTHTYRPNRSYRTRGNYWGRGEREYTTTIPYVPYEPPEFHSYDAASVRFSDMDKEAEKEMAEWDAIIRGERRPRKVER